MSLRITQQIIEVLIKNTGEISVNTSSSLTLDHTVDVNHLTNIKTASASTLIDLDTEATFTGIVEESIQSSLNLQQQVENNFKVFSASNILNLEHAHILAGDIPLSISSILSLTDFANQNLKFFSAANVLNFVQDIILTHNTDTFAASSSLQGLTHEATLGNSIYNRYLPAGFYDENNEFDPQLVIPNDETLNLVHTLQLAGPVVLNVASVLNFNQIINVKQAIINKDLESLISFSHQVGRIFEISSANELEFINEVERRQYPTSLLNFSHLAEAFVSNNPFSILTLSHIVQILAEYNRSVQHNLDISHSFSYNLISATPIECLYFPQVGSTSSGITPPPTTQPVLGKTKLTLTWPFVSPTSTVELRNPEFGNTDRLEFQRINRESRGGTLLIFADPTWPKQQILSVLIEGLKESKKVELLDFLRDSLGQEVGLLDHENRQWRGIILTPDADVTQIGRDDYSISFEFEGELV